VSERSEMHDGIPRKQTASARIESSHHSTGHHGFMHNGNVGMGKPVKMAHHSNGEDGFFDQEVTDDTGGSKNSGEKGSGYDSEVEGK